MHFIKHFILSFHRFNCNLEHFPQKIILRHRFFKILRKFGPRKTIFSHFFYLITRCDGTRQTKEDTWECHQIRKTLHSIIKRKQFFDNLGDHCHCTTFGRKYSIRKYTKMNLILLFMIRVVHATKSLSIHCNSQFKITTHLSRMANRTLTNFILEMLHYQDRHESWKSYLDNVIFYIF